jgi:hypothetical protein
MEIKIVQKGDHIEPEHGVQFQVPAAEVVTFTTETDKGAQGLAITFVDRSPFDRKVVPYGTPLKIVARVDADRNRNRYPFICEMTINGQPFKSGPPNGGEMEVIKTEA